MADLTKVTVDYDVNSVMRALVIPELFAGEALEDGDACYIKSDGKVWKSVSTVVDARTIETGTTDFVENISKFDGLVKGDKAVGEAVTLVGRGSIWEYAAGMTIGAWFYASSNAGLLSDARVATGDSAIAKAIDAKHILIVR